MILKKTILKKLIAFSLAFVLMLSVTACGQNSEEPIKIATKPMTEGYILGEMLGLLIEEYTDYTVEITKGIGGGTANIHPAMQAGDFDLYPEYTSSGWVLVLDQDPMGIQDDEMFEMLNKQYQEQYNMQWISLYGFNNTFTLAVRQEVAEQYNLTKTSDLSAISSELNFGGNPDYIEREDGFALLASTYNLNFNSVLDIDIGLKYTALFSGDIDVTNAFTTDAQLASDGVVTLEDDLNLQVNYFCSTVVRNEALEKYPGLEEVLMKMNNILSDSEMADLNNKVEVQALDEKQVAMDFLTQKGLIEGS